MAGIKESELPIKCLSEKEIIIPDLEQKIKKYFQLSKLKKMHLKFF